MNSTKIELIKKIIALRLEKDELNAVISKANEIIDKRPNRTDLI